MAEKKVQKIKVRSDYLSDSESSEEDEDPQMAEKQDVDDLDTIAYTPEESEEEPFNTAIDNTSEDQLL